MEAILILAKNMYKGRVNLQHCSNVQLLYSFLAGGDFKQFQPRSGQRDPISKFNFGLLTQNVQKKCESNCMMLLYLYNTILNGLLPLHVYELVISSQSNDITS